MEEAGWRKGPDGIRAKDGKKLKFVYQTLINTPRQKTQAIVKQACEKAGIEMELKSVTAAVFFSSDVANPETYPHFYCDIQMDTIGSSQPHPFVFLNQFVSAINSRLACRPSGWDSDLWSLEEWYKDACVRRIFRA